MNVNNAYILEDRGILHISGTDAKDFLQNIVTNDLNNVSDSRSCFSSLLTPQGKFLFEFLVIKHKEGYFFDCEKSQINDLFKQLSLYKLRSNVQILNLSNEFVVTALRYEKVKSNEGTKDELGFTIKYLEDSIFLDPRNKKLGARLIINLEKLNLSLKKLNLKSVKPEEYYDLSFELGIHQKNTNKLKDKIFGLECNFEELNAISFQKGCYVGQENTSRIKLRNKLRRRILPIKKISGELNENDTIKYKNKEIGKILITKPYTFGLIKIVEPDLKEFADIELECDKSKVKILKPEWI